MKYAVLIFCLLLAACGDGNKDGYNSAYKDNRPAPATTAESSWRRPAIEHYQGKAKFFYFGDFKPSQAVIDAAAKGMERTWAVLEQEYPNHSALVKFDQYAVVFWKPSPLCKSAPAFTISYIQTDPNDPYAQDGDYDIDQAYDKDPRKGRVTICAAGKSEIHTWNQGKPKDFIPDSVHRMDLVEDAAMTEPAARHETLHLGLYDLDRPRHEATIYHGGDWETLLNKVEGTAVGFAGNREPHKYARIKGTIDGEAQEFGVVLVK
jgi:hypothetical protein